MTLLSFLSASAVHDLGWTLLHFLWQGLLLAAVLELTLNFVRSATARHNWTLATLVLMLLAPVLTFLSLHGQGYTFSENGAALTPPADVGVPLDLIVTSAAPTPWVNWLVLLWLSGIAALSLRALGGWVLVETLRRVDTETLPAELMERCRALQTQLQVRRPVRFLKSLRVSMPVVVGWLRPVILIPVSALVGLAPQQLDALILHELAHIRRHDAFINALLLAAETVLFYHPAVWWVSRRIRIERENCCDDLAVARCGGAALYVEALASLEAKRLPPSLALAAGGRLKDRAARLLGVPSQTHRYSLGAITGLAAVTLIAVSVALAQPGSAVPTVGAAQIDFVGNNAFDAATLKALIKEKERLVPALSNNKNYDDDRIHYDMEILGRFYRDHGYADFKLTSAVVKPTPGARSFSVKFTVAEGIKYNFGNIAISSPIPTLTEAELRPLLHFKTGDVADLSLVEKAGVALTKAAAAKGYKDYASTIPDLGRHKDSHTIDIAFMLTEGPPFRLSAAANTAAPAVPASINLPKGAHILSNETQPGRLILHIRNPDGGEEIDIVDTGTGKLLTRIAPVR